MKRTIAFILLASILLISLVGCDVSSVSDANGVSAEFKETMDAYEDFFDEYIAFMKKYQANPSDLSLMVEYASFMSEYASMMSKMSALGNTDMNEAETEYYLEVTNRINKKLLDVTK